LELSKERRRNQKRGRNEIGKGCKIMGNEEKENLNKNTFYFQ
jgi:hypothetical protein